MTIALSKTVRDVAARTALAAEGEEIIGVPKGDEAAARRRRNLLGLGFALFAFFCAAALGLILVLPARIEIDVAAIRTDLAWALSACCLLAFCAAVVFLKTSWRRTPDGRRVQPSLDELSEPEREIIERCLRFNRRTILCSIDEPGPARLRQRGWLLPATGSHPRRAWPHTIPKPVWQALRGPSARRHHRKTDVAPEQDRSTKSTRKKMFRLA